MPSGGRSTASRASPGMTIDEAVKALEADGFAGQFVVRGPDGLECRTCGTRRDPAQVTLRRESRIEGESDPADEAVVAGLECPCGALGMAIFTYGPAGSPEEAAVLGRLKARTDAT